MKIVVIGGTGLIGSKLVPKLREQGHEAVAASPNSGINSVTGKGLGEVLYGASVVVDVSNSPSLEDAAVLKCMPNSLLIPCSRWASSFCLIQAVDIERLGPQIWEFPVNSLFQKQNCGIWA